MHLEEKGNNSNPQSIKDVFITRKEVAQELACSVSYVDILRRNGFLKSYKVGRLVRFDRNEIIIAIRRANDYNLSSFSKTA